jgi:copper(I)-binding protein
MPWKNLVVLPVLVAGAGCSGSGTITVIDAWARPTPPTADVGAVYLSVENGTRSDESIATASIDRCGRVEFHVTEVDQNEVITMRPAWPDLLTIPAGGALELAPGGLHLMCLDQAAPLMEGEQLRITIEFESGTTVQAEVAVEQR